MALTSLFSTAGAEPCCAPDFCLCDSSWLCGWWEVGGAALWEEPCVQAFSFADGQTFLDNGRTTHTLFDVKPHFHWGFRVWASWYSEVPCLFANATYKHIHSYRDGKSVDIAPYPVAVINHIGEVFEDPTSSLSARQRTLYDTAYLRFGHNFYCDCDSFFYAFVDGRYVGAEIQRNVNFQAIEGRNSPAFWEEKSRFDGGGLELGVGGEYGICGCLSAAGFFSTMGLIGNRSDSWERNQTFQGIGTIVDDYKKRNFVNSIVGFNLRAGLNYKDCFCLCGYPVRVVGEIGYEIDYYVNILGLRLISYLATPAFADTTLPDATHANFGTSGLYLSLAIRV